jgi:hypothetical protein
MKSELKHKRYEQNKIKKDMFAINHRFQGVAEKKPETQETVLVKRIKLEVRSEKVEGQG